jgi:hypothetical protein
VHLILQSYARFAVENQVHQIFVALKSNPGMLDHLPALGDIWFEGWFVAAPGRTGPQTRIQGIRMVVEPDIPKGREVI